MKVLQINTVYKEKSTGRTCYEVEKTLNEKGHQSLVAYGVGKHSSKNVYRIDRKLEYLFHNIMSRVTGLEGYFSYFATKRLIRVIKKYNPDVIHLRNLHGHYLHLPTLFKFLANCNIPIIQNLHDMWVMTGKCCYYTTLRCFKWESECGNCPALHQYPKSWLFDWSKKMRRDKEKWYSMIKRLTVVGVSKWTRTEAERSFLGKLCAPTYLYNWINADVFKPYNFTEFEYLYEKYGIDRDKRIVLGVSAEWTCGTPRFEDFMKISDLIGDDCIIVLVGRIDHSFTNNRVVAIDYVENTIELAKLYSLADVYVHCSIEDTFGKVIAEAQACGTPAIVYNITGCKEIVINEKSGYVVEPRNIEQVIEKIRCVLEGDAQSFSQEAVENVKMNFDYKTNINRLIQIYENAVQ